MKYSLFRFIDICEITIIYLICFTSNSIFVYVENLDLESSSILKSFVESIINYKFIINILLTFMIVVFHYQFLNRRKTEILCRLLVGDTLKRIKIRYIYNNIIILIFSFLISLLLNFYINQDPTSNIYLVTIFITYILFSIGQVKKE